ncbi:MAG: GNAT family N-acetyltransferase, partial [Mesorhizobium sp.]
ALCIRPYPSGWEKETSAGGAHYHVRPIKPTDIALYPEFLAKISSDDLRLRFLSPRKSFSDQVLKRLTQLDYDRNMAFVALDKSTGALAGISRLSCDPDHVSAEYALLVRTDLQGHGLGWELLSQIVDYAKADGIRRIGGIVLGENSKMLAMCREFGFSLMHLPNEPRLVEAKLELG